MKKITDEQFIAAMREAVKVRGEDFVYPDEWREDGYGACHYTVNGEGACIVGKALEIAAGEPYEGDNGGAYVVLSEVFGLSEKVAEAARNAQVVQDNSRTWGEALADFEATLALWL